MFLLSILWFFKFPVLDLKYFVGTLSFTSIKSCSCNVPESNRILNTKKIINYLNYTIFLQWNTVCFFCCIRLHQRNGIFFVRQFYSIRRCLCFIYKWKKLLKQKPKLIKILISKTITYLWWPRAHFTMINYQFLRLCSTSIVFLFYSHQ